MVIVVRASKSKRYRATVEVNSISRSIVWRGENTLTKNKDNQTFYRSYAKGEKKGVALSLKVQPRSSKCGPLGLIGLQFKWGVGAAPDNGAANKELIKTVAKYFDIPQSRVEILSGETSRSKVILLEGISTESIKLQLIVTDPK